MLEADYRHSESNSGKKKKKTLSREILAQAAVDVTFLIQDCFRV